MPLNVAEDVPGRAEGFGGIGGANDAQRRQTGAGLVGGERFVLPEHRLPQARQQTLFGPLLEQDALRELWPPEAARIVEMRLPPEEKLARLHRLDGTCRWSLLPFCAVGTEAGLLLAVRSDYVKVGSITYPRILLALTPGAVSDGGGYQALWGGRKERRHGESAKTASSVAQRPAG